MLRSPCLEDVHLKLFETPLPSGGDGLASSYCCGARSVSKVQSRTFRGHRATLLQHICNVCSSVDSARIDTAAVQQFLFEATSW